MLGSFSSESILLYVLSMALSVPGIIFAFTFKGFAQAFVSKKLGDPTPEAQGRLTLNPLAHIDWFGLICMIAFGFGWGKPMMTNSRYYKNVKRGKAIYCLSGPVALILVSFILQGISTPFNCIALVKGETAFGVFSIIATIFNTASLYSIVLGSFYLLPLPGLDGYNLITTFTPASFNQTLYKIERYSTFIFLGFILLMRFTVLGTIIFLPAYRLHDLYTSIWNLLISPFFGL
ncbi:MAG: site-2 protease family protein [Clostridia bacterium]|nr:site-2 protease family protein [Clostridia bacterium]